MSWILLLWACRADVPTPPEEPRGEPPVEAPAPEQRERADIPPEGEARAPVFSARAEPLSDALREAMTGVSWREGCPVGLDELRVLHLTHWTFEGTTAEGRLIVAEGAVEPLTKAFAAAFDEEFPIERIEPVHLYGGDDDRSMAANNTSAFNCRPVAGTKTWSEHSFGAAVDINPVQNPWVSGDRVEPPAGREYLDRDDRRPGMLHADSALVRSLREQGWGWGGTWSRVKDYQHLSQSGR